MSEYAGRSYGKGYANVRIDADDAISGLEGFSVTAKKALKSYLEEEAAPMLRDYMQNNHGWQNRTYTAEVGLTVDVVSEGNMKRDDYSLHVEMYHTAKHNGYEYGRYLEGIDPGKNGVIRTDLGVLEKTARLQSPIVVNGMKNVLERYS